MKTPRAPLAPRIAYVLPTRNRATVLAATLAALGALPKHAAEVVVVDNASDPPARLPATLADGLRTTLIRRDTNEGAAGRNAGVAAASESCEWIVMLDDDSNPLNLDFLDALAEAAPDVAAVAAEILLPPRDTATTPVSMNIACREAGGLPEVFIGCGVAIRRRAFIDAGGYDPSFGYYAEEYDLSAKFLLAGMRIVLDRRFQVLHHKIQSGRDMNVILHRLVRNNAWVMQRYAPSRQASEAVNEVMARYAAIAAKEHAMEGYRAGAAEAFARLPDQKRTPMNPRLWARFTGRSVARRSLLRAWAQKQFATAAIVEEGKNAEVVREVLEEMGVRIVPRPQEPEALVIGTLSPGPMLDAWDKLRSDARVVAPWRQLIEGQEQQISLNARKPSALKASA